MSSNNEYSLYQAISTYLKLQYPNVLYHFDPTGLNLSKAQSGMLKAIQHSKGWPDLFIAESDWSGEYFGLFLEIKVEGTRTLKKDGTWISDHIRDQAKCLELLNDFGYQATFAIGFDGAKKIIDKYLKNK